MVWWALVAGASATEGPDCQAFAFQTKMEWVTREELVADEAKKAATELRAPEEVPIAWYVYLANITDRIDDAAPERYLLVIKDATDRELVRQKGERRVPRRGGDHWIGSLGIGLPEVAALPVRVYLVDTLLSRRCAWTVSAKEGGGVTIKLTPSDESPAPTAPAPAAAPTCRTDCCKVCVEGRACGDTCISTQDFCASPRGCACHAWEPCK